MSKLGKRERDPDLKFMDSKNSKYGKNLQKVKDMVDGTYGRKIVVGDASVGHHPNDGHKIGDKWTDSDGIRWEQKDGYRSQVSNIPSKGIADNCSDCESYCIRERDKVMYTKFGRCFSCQLDFEAQLELYPIKYWAWSRLQKLRAWESIDKEALQWFEEKEKMDNKKIYDMSVANALANANIDMSIKKNTQ